MSIWSLVLLFVLPPACQCITHTSFWLYDQKEAVLFVQTISGHRWVSIRDDFSTCSLPTAFPLFGYAASGIFAALELLTAFPLFGYAASGIRRAERSQSIRCARTADCSLLTEDCQLPTTFTFPLTSIIPPADLAHSISASPASTLVHKSTGRRRTATKE
jgi:hypothetical protein